MGGTLRQFLAYVGAVIGLVTKHPFRRASHRERHEPNVAENSDRQLV